MLVESAIVFSNPKAYDWEARGFSRVALTALKAAFPAILSFSPRKMPQYLRFLASSQLTLLELGAAAAGVLPGVDAHVISWEEAGARAVINYLAVHAVSLISEYALDQKTNRIELEEQKIVNNDENRTSFNCLLTSRQNKWFSWNEAWVSTDSLKTEQIASPNFLPFSSSEGFPNFFCYRRNGHQFEFQKAGKQEVKKLAKQFKKQGFLASEEGLQHEVYEINWSSLYPEESEPIQNEFLSAMMEIQDARQNWPYPLEGLTIIACATPENEAIFGNSELFDTISFKPRFGKKEERIFVLNWASVQAKRQELTLAAEKMKELAAFTAVQSYEALPKTC